MKIAVSALDEGMDAKLDPRFGRATGFMLVDTEQGTEAFIENRDNLALAQGAGIHSHSSGKIFHGLTLSPSVGF